MMRWPELTKYYVYLFVFGLVLEPVILWQSTYDFDCKSSLLEIRNYLTDEEQLKYSEDESKDIERCYRNRMSGVGGCSPSDGESYILKCNDFIEIQFCEDHEPVWLTVVKFFQSIFFGFWTLIFILGIFAIGEAGFMTWLTSVLVTASGVMAGLYLTRWLYLYHW